MFKKKRQKIEEIPVRVHQPSAAVRIGHTLAIASGKGGVGKSTVTAQLAMGLAQQGLSVGLIDADIYGPSQSKLFGLGVEQTQLNAQGRIQPMIAHGVKVISTTMLLAEDSPVIWRAPMATKLIRDFLSRVDWQTDLDILLLDLPPGTGDIQITLAQQAKLSGAIIVTTPQQMATDIAAKALQMFSKVHVPIVGVIENMSGFVCEQCHHDNHIFQTGGGARLAEQYHTSLLANIPLDAALLQACDAGQSFLETDSPAAKAYVALSKTLPNLLKEAKTAAEDPSKIDLQPNGLHLSWPDGTEQHYSAHALRLACPCALCIDEMTSKPLLDPSTISKDIALENIQRVGRYGLKLQFSDGHNTGIYTFSALKILPACDTHPDTEPSVQTEPLTEAAVRKVLDTALNPQVAAHGGKIELIRVEDDIVYVKLTGGCQGCSQANVTLKQGAHQLLKRHFPSLKKVIDTTNHQQGENPYF